MPPTNSPSEIRNFLHRRATDSELIIHAVNLELTQDIVVPSLDLTVYADEVVIGGQLRLPSRNVSIHARRIIANVSEAKIDVSGSNGRDAPASRAQDGVGDGGHGNAGVKGGDGAKGGKVLIIGNELEGRLSVVANGGAGGRGQDGGNGQRGANGSEGEYRGCREFEGLTEGGKGGTGFPGGNAGAGGIGGSGGDAGGIEVRLVRTPESGSLNLSCDGGAGGPTGRHGRPGRGGEGGLGGHNAWSTGPIDPGPIDPLGFVDPFFAAIHPEALRILSSLDNPATGPGDGSGSTTSAVTVLPKHRADFELTESARASFRGNCTRQESRGPRGDEGPSGAEVQGVPTHGEHGKPTNLSGAVLAVDHTFVGSTGTTPQQAMALHFAENEYLKNTFGRCATILNWLDLTTVGLPRTPELDAFRARVRTLRLQLSNGLDFYGLPRHYVPAVALEAFRVTVPRMLQLAKSMEESYDRYWDETRGVEDRLRAMDNAMTQSQASINVLEQERTAVNKRADETQNVVESLRVSMEDQGRVLMSAAEDFKRAVENQAGCNFFDIVQFVAAVASVAAGAYQNIESIIDNVGDLTEAGLELEDVVQKLKVVRRDLEELRAAYTEIRNLFPDKPDAAKIVIDRAEYEEALKPFLDLEEAREYRDQIRLYLELAEARNHKLLEYTSLVVLDKQIESKISHLTAEIAKVRATMALTRDPALVECVTLMSALMWQAKTTLTRALYQEHRAYEYWALAEAPLPFVGDERIAALEFTQLTIEDLVLQERNNRGAAKQPFRGVEVLLRDVDFADLVETSPDKTKWKLFQETGRLSFQIPINHPSFAGIETDLTVSSVKVTVPGAETTNGRLRLDITHNGVALFKTSADIIRRYTHKTRSRSIWYDMRTGQHIVEIENNLGGEEGQFVYLSPFSFWTIIINPDLNTGLNLSNVSKVQLEFSGTFLR